MLLLETFYAAEANVWFWLNGCWFWFGSVKRFGNGGMKIGSCIDILNNWVCHGWEGQTGVVMINVHLSLLGLANTLPIRAKGGKVYAFRCVKPKTCITFWNIGLFNIRSLDKNFIYLKALPTLVFKVSDRYSVVSVIWLAKKVPIFPLPPESWVGFLSLPFLPNKVMLLDSPFYMDH